MTLPLACALAIPLGLLTGCGEPGVSSGATVRVYAVASLCAGAKGELEGAGGEAGDLDVRLTCLPPATAGGRSDLAAIGANARRAAEDSTAVAFLEPTGPGVKFRRPILESADIAVIVAGDGREAMARVLAALRDGDPDEPRQAVLEAIEG